MTALDAYLRLESTGLWRPSPEAQRRDVYVFLGDASLVITDKAEQPLSHWSLPALDRLNPGAQPALFMPGADASETLEIEDPEMIAAIEKVQKAIEASAPKPGRLRLWSGLAIATALLAGAIWWLPGALVTHADRVVPPSKRFEIGQALQAQVLALTGQACGPAQGSAELRVIARHLGGATAPQLYVVPELGRPSLALPGGIILLDRTTLEEPDSASVLAGHVLAAQVAAAANPPLRSLLEQTSLRTSLSLLTTGTVDVAALRAYAPELLRSPETVPSSAALLPAFTAARVASTPYAEARGLPPSDPLIAQDPFVAGTAPELLPDNSWVALQSLCEI